MPVSIGGVEYLNVNESVDYVASGSPFVFAQLRKRVRIEPHRIVGKGQSKFYKREDLDELKKMMGPHPVEK